jgi:single-strand DNA-binding protein
LKKKIFYNFAGNPKENKVMAGSINKVILVGNLGKDPEVKSFANGMVANFPLATTETYKDRNGNRVDQTEWHNVEVWGDQAKVAEQWLRKGKLIYLEGTIRTDSWEDNGVKKYRTKIRATNFTMLGAAPGGESQASEKSSGKSEETAVPQGIAASGGDTDDLPF